MSRYLVFLLYYSAFLKAALSWSHSGRHASANQRALFGSLTTSDHTDRRLLDRWVRFSRRMADHDDDPLMIFQAVQYE
ncbi:Oidioi.mRNA.OKI2018_I69.chr2.g8285.t1.cds [Oikopleura dioica]|uniref:Oidioi.mRNA.OKI2018_I69.chr2.g8285.t1.cds n=1 Tax=Oikopleura dioica TaxID=34765 RepID=A0ABN7TGP2_OIKDI|nr:Oidioi.mRNA.OKI2018_I69.chr2.g8285.t1.cds [Oikopleura dioica]